jgi:hypothetical protein
VIFNLTLETEDTSVQGTQSLNATGVAVPEPASALLFCWIGGFAVLRRIRRTH